MLSDTDILYHLDYRFTDHCCIMSYFFYFQHVSAFLKSSALVKLLMKPFISLQNLFYYIVFHTSEVGLPDFP